MTSNDNHARVRAGVNYIPAKGWWYAWVDWDSKSIRADLQAIADLGFDHIRIQLLWLYAQYNGGRVNASVVAHLDELLAIADELALDVQITVLNGQLSGLFWYPNWIGDPRTAMVMDESTVRAELQLFDTLARVATAHPSFSGFDIGNELNTAVDATPDVADPWASRLLSHCAQIAPEGMHVNGVDQAPWFEAHTFSQHTLATTGGVSVYHAWPEYTGAVARYGLDGTGTRHLGEYFAELSNAFATDPGRKTWMQEFGCSALWRNADAIPEFAETFVANALSSSAVCAWTWWASHDIDPLLTGFAPVEYDLGLLTIHNTVKPAGERLSRFVAEQRASATAPATRTTALVLDDPRRAGLEFADHFFALIDAGVRPAIILAARSTDEAYLRRRGITTVLRTSDTPAAVGVRSNRRGRR